METAVPEDHLKYWGHKHCHVLTVALHRRTGWPIATLHDKRIYGGCTELDEYGSLAHSGVVAPDGSFVDIYGVHGPEALAAVEDRYIHWPETFARWLNQDMEIPEFHLLEAIIEKGDELDALLREAEAAIDAHLGQVMASYAGLTPFPVP